jgi:hypothetical protein
MIYERGRSAQNSSHTDSRVSTSSRDSRHAKNSSRLVEEIPIFLIIFFFFPKVKTGLSGKGFQDTEDVKNNVAAELKAGSFGDLCWLFSKAF